MSRPNMARVRKALAEYIDGHERSLPSPIIKTVLEGETELRMLIHYIASYHREITGYWSVGEVVDEEIIDFSQPKQMELFGNEDLSALD